MTNKHSSINKRIIGTSLDILALSVVLSPIMSLVERMIYGERNMLQLVEEISEGTESNQIDLVRLVDALHAEHFFTKYIGIQGIFFFIVGILMIFMWKKYSTTPGKWLMGSRVVSIDSYGSITLKQSILRFMGYFISVTPLFLGVFIAAFNKDRRCWHDVISKTVVIDFKHDFTLFEKIRGALLSPKKN